MTTVLVWRGKAGSSARQRFRATSGRDDAGKNQNRRVALRGELKNAKAYAAFSVETFWRGGGVGSAGILRFAQNDELKNKGKTKDKRMTS